MTAVNISAGNEVDTAEAAAFLRQVFSETKSRFIIEHGRWLYHGLENQWFMLLDDRIVGYCAIIPVGCAVHGARIPALWWVDLIIDPAGRGQGLQSIFDAKIRTVADLILGFPNELAAKIHRKHQWGVREDGDVLLLPLVPTGVKTVLNTQGFRGNFMQAFAAGLSPVASVWRRRLLAMETKNAARWPEVTTASMARIFEVYKEQYAVTAYRDVDYCQWRYFDNPDHAELAFYRVGPVKSPTHYLVARRVFTDNVSAVRILDIFGDLNNMEAFQQLVLLALQDSIARGATQITTLNFTPQLRPLWRSLGFIVRTPGRFCWHSQDQLLMKQFEQSYHWVLGDSDLDEPV